MSSENLAGGEQTEDSTYYSGDYEEENASPKKEDESESGAQQESSVDQEDSRVTADSRASSRSQSRSSSRSRTRSPLQSRSQSRSRSRSPSGSQTGKENPEEIEATQTANTEAEEEPRQNEAAKNEEDRKGEEGIDAEEDEEVGKESKEETKPSTAESESKKSKAEKKAPPKKQEPAKAATKKKSEPETQTPPPAAPEKKERKVDRSTGSSRQRLKANVPAEKEKTTTKFKEVVFVKVDPTPTQAAQRLQQHQDIEQVEREEVGWEESSGFLSILASADRTFALQNNKEEARRQREAEEQALAKKTLLRRQRSVSVSEQKKRLVIMETEQLELEVILRNLERDIRHDVFNAAVEMAIRVKYFNKTSDVIVRNEQQARRDFGNSERYERLVMKSQMDTKYTNLLLRDKLNKLRKSTEANMEQRKTMTPQKSRSLVKGQSNKTSRTQSPAASNTGSAATAPGSDGETPAEESEKLQVETGDEEVKTENSSVHQSPTRKYKSVACRVNVSHSPEYYDRVSMAIQTREERKREEVEEEEANTRVQGVEFFSETLEIRREEEKAMAKAVNHARALFWNRQFESVVKKELKARAALEEEHNADWKGVERKNFRAVVSNSRQMNSDQHHHSIHERKLGERRHRMMMQQMQHEARRNHEAENAGDEGLFAPVSSMVAAMPPVPPSVMRSQHETGRDTLAGAMLSHEEKRKLAAYRIASKNEDSHRKLLEKEERMDRHHVLMEMKAPSSTNERDQRARTRRGQTEVQNEKKIRALVHYEDGRSVAARSIKKIHCLERTLLDLQNQETAARVFLNQEYQRFVKMHTVTVEESRRTAGHMSSLLATEEKKRDEMMTQEARYRTSLQDLFKFHKPQAPLERPKPLPPPRAGGFHYDHSFKIRKENPKQPEYDMNKFKRKHNPSIRSVPTIQAMLFQTLGATSKKTLGGTVGTSVAASETDEEQDAVQQEKKEADESNSNSEDETKEEATSEKCDEPESTENETKPTSEGDAAKDPRSDPEPQREADPDDAEEKKATPENDSKKRNESYDSQADLSPISSPTKEQQSDNGEGEEQPKATDPPASTSASEGNLQDGQQESSTHQEPE